MEQGRTITEGSLHIYFIWYHKSTSFPYNNSNCENRGDYMKKKWKGKLAKLSNCNRDLNRKVLKIKHSWDEVDNILNALGKKGKRRK